MGLHSGHRMRHLLLALAGIVLSGSLADASPAKSNRVATAKKRKKAKPVQREASDDVVVSRHRRATTDQPERVAATEPAPTLIELDLVREAPERDLAELRDDVPRHRAPRRANDWRVAVGPYLWASSVDADVSVGAASLGAGVDFVQTVKHARYGAEILGEIGYGRFSLSGDLMYGVVGIDGGTALGPVMLTVNGEVSSVMLEGAAGYLVAGDEHSMLALEGRAGVRYQRTSIQASVGVAGAEAGPPESIDAGRDVLAGARLFFRPASWFYVTGVGDLGMFGTSTNTWSFTADANLKLASHVLISLGYRTLTIDRSNLSLVMHGPRAAVQLVF